MEAQSLHALAGQPRRAAEEAREWLLDCFADEDDRAEIRLLNQVGLVLAVQTHYDGGYGAFLADFDNLKTPR